jgi:hypothetical protein
MAGLTRLELATSYVTGRRSNQLNYNPDSYAGYTVSRYSDDNGENRPTSGFVPTLPCSTMSLSHWAVLDSN